MKRIFPKFALASAVAMGVGAPLTVTAGPSDYVATPIVEEGEREIDFKAGSARLRDGSRASAQSIGLGWGATRWWFTEVYAKWHRAPGETHGFDAWEWENRFQLTETGRHGVDIGFLLELERPKDRSEGYELRWGPLLQTELTPTVQANLNLLIEKHFRAAQPTRAELGYQWQLKYRWKPAIEWGVQGLGSVGPWNDWAPSSQQTHVAGPALFGRIGLGGRQTIKYNAAVLYGLNTVSPQPTLRAQVEYEF
jgi:hypothetical protein